MKRRNIAEIQVMRRYPFTILVLGLCLASAAVPTRSLAQDLSQANILPVADVTLFPLANTTMASVKGTGLQGPGLAKSPAPMGTIILWDEMKPQMPQQNIISGSQVITINGVGQ